MPSSLKHTATMNAAKPIGLTYAVLAVHEQLERQNDLLEVQALLAALPECPTPLQEQMWGPANDRLQQLRTKLWPQSQNPMNHVFDSRDVQRRDAAPKR